MSTAPKAQRVRGYVVEGKVNDAWKTLAPGSSIGHKKMDQFEPVEVMQLRLKIAGAAAEPVIRNFAAYQVEKP